MGRVFARRAAGVVRQVGSATKGLTMSSIATQDAIQQCAGEVSRYYVLVRNRLLCGRRTKKGREVVVGSGSGV